MARYDYICQHCQHQFEVEQSMLDSASAQCPKCKKMTTYRLINIPALVFKGEGFPGHDLKRKENNYERPS